MSPANENRLKWTEIDSFVRVQFRFWSFESISIELKFLDFLKSILIHIKR